MLQLSGLARSTFYYYLKYLNTDKYECEKQEIVDIYNANKGRYGYRRITIANVCDEKVYLSPVLDLFNNEIVSYSISTSPNLEQVREMLNGLFAKLLADATPIFHSDQGWQYQHAEYQRLLAEHNITQSMSRKGNCMDNGAMENFFGRLKVEMFYGEKFESVNAFIDELKKYIDYYNNERISLKLKGMSPVQYRTHSLTI